MMAESRFAKVWDVLSKYDFEINEDVSAEVVCIMCKKIMTDPYAAMCGCHYCCRCITEFIGQESRKKCPGSRKECSEDFLDMKINVSKSLGECSKIANTIVTCPNELCSEKSKIENIEEHIRICPMRSLKCPYDAVGCLNHVLNSENILDHLNSCELTHSQLLNETINIMKNDFNVIKQNLEIKGNEIKELEAERGRIKGENELLKEDSKIKEALMIEMRKEIDDMTNTIKLIADKEETKECEHIVSNEDMKDREMQMKVELDDLKSEILMIREEGKEMKTELDDLKSDIVVMKNQEGVNKLDIVAIAGNEDFSNLMKKHDEDISLLRNEVKKYNEELKIIRESTISKNHDFIWTINDFSKKNGQFFSESFYVNNYKLFLRAYIDNNVKFGCFTLYVVIVKGDKDEEAQWPMRHTITVSIVDQESLKTQKFWKVNYETYDKSKPVFNRPEEAMNDNILCGSNSIIDIQELLFQDSLIVCCSLSVEQ